MSNMPDLSFFNFSSFLSFLALFTVIYMITDVRYKFRISLLPIYILLSPFAIGFVTLLVDVGVRKDWGIFSSIILDPVLLSAFLGGLLLFLMVYIIIRIYFLIPTYSILQAPVFNKYNYKKYYNQIKDYIFKGYDSELSIVADELGRSIHIILELSNPEEIESFSGRTKSSELYKYCYKLIELIGNRKFCKQLISNSPQTAIKFFDSISSYNYFPNSLKPFSRNVIQESINNEESILYSEDDFYDSGEFGRAKLFTQSCTNIKIVEELNILAVVNENWNANQLKAYTRLVFAFSDKYFQQYQGINFSSFFYVLENLSHSTVKIGKIENIESDYFSSEVFKQFSVVVDLIARITELPSLNEIAKNFNVKLRAHEKNDVNDLFDFISNCIVKILLYSTSVKSANKYWFIYFGTVWFSFFKPTATQDSRAEEIIYFRIRRLIYNELKTIDSFNYKSAALLGFCLNIMGFELSLDIKNEYIKRYAALHKVILKLVKDNFLNLYSNKQKIAIECLFGSISFDDKKKRLIKTSADGAKSFMNLN